MTQAICANNGCRAPLGLGDQFCGGCGTPVPAVTTETMPAHNREEPFFSHEPRRHTGRLNNTTRYLCAAAYLDEEGKFADKVIWHLMATRQAVAPSINFDVGPVLRHCLRARRNILIRNIVLVGIAFLALVLSPATAFAVLLWAIVFGALPRLLRKLPKEVVGALLARLLLTAGGVAAIGLGIGLVLLMALGALAATAVGPLGLLGGFLSLFLVLGGAWITEYMFVRTTRATLADELRLGAEPPGPAPGAAEQRIAMVEGAQWGNITLHGDYFPFVGAGAESDAHWSIAIRLDPAPGLERTLLGASSSANGEHVHIDPVELHRRIRERLLELNDPSLPVNERMGALEISDRLVGSGFLQPDSPLIDRARSTPYSHASVQAIEALMRHPQAGLRYYQQVSVNDEGPAVISDGRKVLDGVDQQVAVSAFVYAAVEGHMFYLQYVLTALPPVLAKYRQIDYLPGTSSPSFGRLVRRETTRRLLSSIVSAPAGLYSAFRLWRDERSMAQMYLTAAYGDFGAMLSTRQEGTAGELGTYMRELDVEKYNRIFARLLVETVQEFLADNGVNTSAFENSAMNVINGDVNYIRENNAEVHQFGGHGNKHTGSSTQPARVTQ